MLGTPGHAAALDLCDTVTSQDQPANMVELVLRSVCRRLRNAYLKVSPSIQHAACSVAVIDGDAVHNFRPRGRSKKLSATFIQVQARKMTKSSCSHLCAPPCHLFAPSSEV